jgi:hypothetical protein
MHITCAYRFFMHIGFFRFILLVHSHIFKCKINYIDSYIYQHFLCQPVALAELMAYIAHMHIHMHMHT